MQQSATQPQQFGRPQPQAAQPKKPQLLPLEDVHLDEILHIVVEKNASDLHMAVGVPPTLRVDGALLATNYERLSPQISQRLVYDILTDEQIQRFENNMELDFSYSLQNLARFRVNAYKDRGTVASAFRLIPQRIPTLSDLGLPKVVVELSTRPRGLVLVTGPTGSGKSTTLASMVHMMNCERSLHIITVEDPIEYLHSHRKSIINQRELGQDTLSFPAALRSCLREDPDVILCGEMRDLDTIAIAITMAETGHLVLATLHTNTAAESIDRMIDVFPSSQQQQIRVQLSNNLVAVLSQQLLPRAGGPGRVAAIEVMIASPAIRNLVREAKAHQINSIIQTSGEMGMQTMDQDLAELYKKGLITYDEAMIRAVQQEELKKLMSSPGVG
jgi:twitching motility protein PilT